MFITNAVSRIFFGIYGPVTHGLSTGGLMLWDVLLTLANVVLPNRRRGTVIAAGYPGRGGLWPPFEPPREGDSRGPCPALNALANHGILPRDGKNISIKGLVPIVVNSYNFSTTFAVFTCDFVAQMLQKSYSKDTIDLSDLNVHNGIEHDASLTRHDVYHQPDQSVPAQDLIDALLAEATGKDKEGRPLLTVSDLSRFSTVRRNHSKATNGQYTLDTFHKIFGSSNSTTLLTIFGGRVDDLKVILKEERLPDGWEPRIRTRNGLTMIGFNPTVLHLELGIEETRGQRMVRLA